MTENAAVCDRLPAGITGLTADSRAVRPGYLFGAFKGSAADGRDYVGQALDAGAAAILTDELPDDVRDRFRGQAELLLHPNPRRCFAELAAVFHGPQPACIALVTGTNGKTSTVEFARQLWAVMGVEAAGLGTLGLHTSAGLEKGSLTTPDPVELAATLARLGADGVGHVAMEASSHGLDQERLSGVHATIGVFTSFSRDHLDYHKTPEAYLDAKLRLFRERLPQGAPAIICADMPVSDAVIAAAEEAGLEVWTYGHHGERLRLAAIEPVADGQRLSLVIEDIDYDVILPLVGDFQAENALAALGIVLAAGADRSAAVAALAHLTGVAGRLQLAGKTTAGAAVYVDYAHTPDALQSALTALRPAAADGRLVVLFGAGGDRDPGKRPQMGAVAAAHADIVIVTDDNPRTEDAAAIRKAVLSGCPDAEEIGDRALAIETAVRRLATGDVLLIAGKGHETGQIIGTEALPFDDLAQAQAALAPPAPPPLWTAEEARAATGGAHTTAWRATSVGIDSRQVKPGMLFVALPGEKFDGHDYVAQALQDGAAAAMVSRDVPGLPDDAPLLRVADTYRGLEALGAASRARFGGKVVALTGSVGKTGTKEMLRVALSAQGETSATVGNLNNHIGAPLSLARLPREAQFGVFELGMNHAGEIRPLSKLCRPHCALITRIAPAHIEFFDSLDGIARAKAEIFEGLEPGGTAIVNTDDGYTGLLSQAARDCGAGTVLTFGEAANADARLLGADLGPDGSQVRASILGREITYRIGAPGKHWVLNSLAVLAAVHSVGADVEQAAAALAGISPPAGRGAVERLTLPQGTVTVIDESYNASPAAMRAAFAVLCSHQAESNGRRIAVLGDMLELGDKAPDEHAALGAALAELPVDAVFAAGPEMPALMERLKPEQRAGYAPTAAELAAKVMPALAAGDVVLVKGSLGIGMARVLRALRDSAAGADRPGDPDV